MREPLAFSRRSAAALVLLLGACRPELPETPTDKVVSAVFDPTTASIPLPNDLVFPPFNSNPNSVCPPPANAPSSTPGCAQAELLAAFAGKFPNDQEVAITIQFTQTELHSNGTRTISAPVLDFSSFTSATFSVADVTTDTIVDVPIDPPKASDYVMSTDRGTLTIHHQGRTPWPPGSYAVVMRGGPDGVKTMDGTPVSPSQVFALIATGADFTKDENLGLLRAQLGSIEAARMQGGQLAVLVQKYQGSAFKVADRRFPHEELAIASTFSISDVTNVTVDAGRGIVPLPIDLLRRPDTGKLSALAACTLAGSRLSPDGTCPSAAAGGFQALDGFSTTGAILAPTSDLIIASTARAPGAVQLFDLTNPAQPVAVPASDLIIEPCEFTFNPANMADDGCGTPPAPPLATAVAPVIAIQPAGATSGDATSVFRSRPLKDATDYAVVISNAVLDRNNKPIGRGTVASILRLTNKVFDNNKSQLLGVDDGTAAALEKMRLQLQPVFALPSINRNNVAMAYTFRTQTILSQAVQLAALPYSPAVQPPLSALPLAAPTVLTATQAFTKYGVDSNIVPSSNISQILEVDINTHDALDPITGAFMSDPTKGSNERIRVLIATPNPTVPPVCSGPLAPLAPLRCAPMMVFRHGLGSGRAAMLTVADRFAAAGMVTVAIDAAKHGDRSFCTSGPESPTSGCNGGAACVTLLPAGAQGDARPPGKCGAAGFVKRPVSPTCAVAPSPCPANTDGIPVVSANYVTSTNFFRTRDTFRQDLIDESQLIRALAFAPSGAPPTGHSVFDQMASQGVVIDPGAIYYSGQSLGSVQGAMNVAANSRISKAALNVGGGTIVDISTNSPAFAAGTQAILDQLGIRRGTSQFLQFLVVTKTVLDPADPVNYAGHMTGRMLPDLLKNPNGSVPQIPKKVLTQIANCDGVVPNPFNLISASNTYAGDTPVVPLPSGAAFFAPGARGAFQLFVGAGFHPVNTPFGTCPLAAVVSHAFLTDWTIPSLTQNAQDDIANFVVADTLPLSVQHQ